MWVVVNVLNLNFAMCKFYTMIGIFFYPQNNCWGFVLRF